MCLTISIQQPFRVQEKNKSYLFSGFRNFIMILLFMMIHSLCFSQKTNCLARVKTAEGYGFINKKGVIVLPCTYKYACEFNSGLASVYNGEYITFINCKGKTQFNIARALNCSGNFSEGLIVVIDENKQEKKVSTDIIEVTHGPDLYGFMNTKGQIIIPAVYANAGSFNNGLAPVQFFDTKKWGFINNKNVILIKADYEEAKPFSDGLAPVKLNGKWGYINKTGKVEIEIQYDSAFAFSEGFAAVKKNGKYAFITKTGTLITGFIYDLADGFSNGLAAVNKGGKDESYFIGKIFCFSRLGGSWGFIDKTGKEIIPLQYSSVSGFNDSMAVVKKDSLFGVINMKGEYVIPPKFKSLNNFHCGLAVAFKDGKYGYINKKGEWVIEPKFEEAFDFVNVK